MKALQLHVDFMEYEPVSKEGKVAEETERQSRRVSDALVLFVSVEPNDDEKVASSVMQEAKAHMERVGARRLLIYPYAHLSNKLAPPQKALAILKEMESVASSMGIEVSRAPFGWTKRFTISVKGHPLSEQFRSVEQIDSASTTRAEKNLEKRGQHQQLVEEVKREEREPIHVGLGRQLDIFSVQETTGSGLPLYHPKGFIIRNELINYIREVNNSLGFEEVWTPHVLRSELWYKTGHYEAYRDRMFVLDIDGEEYVIKPMNCPAHAMIYASRPRSYKDLPISLSEFGTVYRNEQSGELTGLLRVRAITQDDGHVFLRPDQIEEVVSNIMRAALTVLDRLIGGEIYVNLSTRPERFIGSPDTWEAATEALRNSLESTGISYEVKEGEGAFYGPKIDIDVKDSLERRWQCTTIQLDFFMPERLSLEYIDSNGQRRRPVMIHRALLGSIERFTALLLEHYGGRLPLWLSPEQVRVVPVSDKYLDYAKRVDALFKSRGIRSTVAVGPSTMAKKIAQAHDERVSFVVIVGEKEERDRTISVRDYTKRTLHDVKPEDFIETILGLIKRRERNVGILSVSNT